MRSIEGNLVRFNSHSLGNYSSALHGSQQIIIEQNTIAIMLCYTESNLCEVLLQGDIIYNVDPDSLDDVTIIN